MPDRRWDEETRTRLEDIAEHYKRFTAKISGLIWAMLGVIAVGGVVFTILLNENSDLATQANHLASSIQANRVAQCQAANQRHRRAVASLKVLEDQQPRMITLPATTAGGQKLTLHVTVAANATSTANTLALVNALAPLHDCSALAGPHAKLG